MKEDLLINDVIRKLNGLIMDFNVYCTLKNAKEESKMFDI